jgi:hypothetical protein
MYVTDDGAKFLAEDEAALVSKMRASSFTPSDNTEHFMRQLAERAMLYNGSSVRADAGVEAFVADLIAAGFVSEHPVN